jgi:hypothetical protein
MTACDVAEWAEFANTRTGRPRARRRTLVGAVSLWLQRGGGLYWVTASVATGFIASTANAWVLLVELKREPVR